ncbi:F0F1 ATP synthase subunit delta [Lolliginicoccus suaedae]|uniref:F0F1 ATP synthase subunit delta n=1 Tax=Lolliginicoccus suaedae TaxID=2605429 RepID=UPI0011EF4383|nr:F0F1 ATP synthase subunit delta [Lolliginicoccus suaedae]
MYAASREALAHTTSALESSLGEASGTAAAAAQAGEQLLAVVDLLDTNRDLRVQFTDTSATPERRASLVDTVFGGKISREALDTLKAAVSQDWSSTSDLLNSLVHVGRIALLRAAAEQDQLQTVEDELFRLGRITASSPELEQALSDRTRPASATRDLLRRLLYGKATAITETLAAQAVSRARQAPANEFASLSQLAAEQSDRTVAHVRSAAPLTDGQHDRLASALTRIYGKPIAIHSEVEPGLLGGLVVSVGDEVIDGSAQGRLTQLRKALK